MDTSPEYAVSEIDRRMANLVRLGTIYSADYAAARVRVQSGDLITDWVPWLVQRAGPDNVWWAPEVGEQCVLLSPDGEPANGVALVGLYQDAHPAPETTPNLHTITYADGTTLTHDRENHLLSLVAVGEVRVQVAGNVTVEVASNATVEVAGNVNLTAGQNVEVTAAGDIVLTGRTIQLN